MIRHHEGMIFSGVAALASGGLTAAVVGVKMWLTKKGKR